MTTLYVWVLALGRFRRFGSSKETIVDVNIVIVCITKMYPSTILALLAWVWNTLGSASMTCFFLSSSPFFLLLVLSFLLSLSFLLFFPFIFRVFAFLYFISFHLISFLFFVSFSYRLASVVRMRSDMY